MKYSTVSGFMLRSKLLEAQATPSSANDPLAAPDPARSQLPLGRDLQGQQLTAIVWQLLRMCVPSKAAQASQHSAAARLTAEQHSSCAYQRITISSHV